MADEQKNTPPTQPDISELGKPASGTKTFIAKVVGGIELAGGAIYTGLGVAQLVTGKKIGGALVEKSTQGLSARRTGTLFAASGALALTLGKSVWDSASSASRTRNYLALADKLNTDKSQARG